MAYPKGYVPEGSLTLNYQRVDIIGNYGIMGFLTYIYIYHMIILWNMRIMRYLLDLLDLWYGILRYLLDLWFGWEDSWDYYDICDLYGINCGITMGFVICIGYSEPLKSTNLTELCQISLGRRWIRKSNKLTKSKVNPNGTPMYDKLCFGKFCCVKDEETPCGRNSQNIFKVVLNTTKNTHVILGRQWFTTCRLQVITRKAAFTCFERRPNDVRTTHRTTSKGIKTQTFGFICFHVPFILLSFPLISFHCPFMRSWKHGIDTT